MDTSPAFASDDPHAELLRVVRTWVERYYPTAMYTTVVVSLPDGVPNVVIPVVTSSASSPKPARKPAASLPRR